MIDVIHAFGDALAESDEPDPRAVAKALAETVPTEDLRPALAQALGALASTMATRERTAIRAAVRSGHDNASARWQSAARSHNAMLRMRIPDGGGSAVFLGDATVDQLLAAAAIRFAHADATRAQGDWFERVAKALIDADVPRPADLDDDRLAALREAMP